MPVTLPARRAALGATALRGGRAWRPTPYQFFGFLFWLLLSLAFWRLPLCCDAGQHAAVVERLRASLLDPRHPTADLPGDGSAAYSPYAVAQGLFARLTGLGGWEVLRLAGPLNLLVLLTGLGRLVRLLTPRPWAPVLALAATTLLWGTEQAPGSGRTGLMALTGTLGHPSTFALGLTLWAWALTGERRAGPSGRPGVAGYAGLGALYGLIVLVDPVTAVGAALGAVAFAVGRPAPTEEGRTPEHSTTPADAGRTPHDRATPSAGPPAQLDGATPPAGTPAPHDRATPPAGTSAPHDRAASVHALLLIAAAALPTAALWPYFDLFALTGGAGADASHRRFPLDAVGQVWLAALGLPALWLRARRTAWRDPLVLLLALDCAVLALGRPTGLLTGGGILGLALVPAQFALAVELSAPRPWRAWRRALGAAAAAGACLGFLSVQAGAVVPRSLDPVGFPQPPRPPTYEWAAQHIRPGEVVIADGRAAGLALAGYGANLAAPARPDASLDERERRERLKDVRAYLSPDVTRARRAAVVRRHHVRWLLLTRSRTLPGEAVVVAWSPRTGEVLARVGR
ncbi:hypothetical protein [Streptomyces sp. NPDC048002]|uniref:hypothetical protein n=1 Tax=Streptomyces sp. NPDC048002 TaxID=3154344 RepID=UPI0033FA8475